MRFASFFVYIIAYFVFLCHPTFSWHHPRTYLKDPTFYEKKFIEWMATFSKTFYMKEGEFLKRLSIFAANDDMITQHNKKEEGYTLAHNEYSDLTWDEFRTFSKGLNVQTNATVSSNAPWLGTVTYENETLSTSVDWVAKGAVTHVKTQGRCGSCWAFSTTGSIEGAIFIQSHKLVNLSEQELVDCDHNGDMGCNGGLMDHAFQWIELNKGICAEADYAYEAHVGQCRICTPIAKVTGYYDIRRFDQKALQKAVAQQPVSVAIEADQPQFQFYSKGIFNATCGTKLDHGVLVVGYGEDNGQRFWKVKNSWGTTWGENGYIRLARDVGGPAGQCGIASVASYPVAELMTEEANKIQTRSKNMVSGTDVNAKKRKEPILFHIAKNSAASSATIAPCGNSGKSLVNFTELSIKPQSPQRGNPVSFYGSGSIAHSFNNASFELTVKLGKLQVFYHNGCMCGSTRVPIPLGLGELDVHGFKCPVSEGNFKDIGAEVNLPIIAPMGKYEITLKTKSSEGDVFCINVGLNLTSEKSKVYEEINTVRKEH